MCTVSSKVDKTKNWIVLLTSSWFRVSFGLMVERTGCLKSN